MRFLVSMIILFTMNKKVIEFMKYYISFFVLLSFSFQSRRLGLAGRLECEEALMKTGWSIERAASTLLENT